MRVWIVMEETGEYSDRLTRPVKAFDSRDKAVAWIESQERTAYMENGELVVCELWEEPTGQKVTIHPVKDKRFDGWSFANQETRTFLDYGCPSYELETLEVDGKDAGRCATCYYYQTVYDRNRPTDRRACFGEHLHAAVGGLDWEDEAECWADMAPSDHCTNWTPRD